MDSSPSGSGGARGAQRHLRSALRGITGGQQEGMEVDGERGAGRTRGGHRRNAARSNGPLDQVS
jgi:hypothetical protein